MSLLLEQLEWLANQRSEGIALQDQNSELTWCQLLTQVRAVQSRLHPYQCAAVALVGDNHLQWLSGSIRLIQVQ